MNKKYIIVFFMLIISLGVAKQNPRGLDNALDISTSGVIAQRTRAQVIAENVANIDTVKTQSGLPYRRKVAIIRARENLGSNQQEGALQGVVVERIEEAPASANAFQRVYNPEHPDADAQGFVSYPKIDLTKEMVELSQASGAFENNVVVFNTTKAMMQSSLELGQ